MHSGMQDTDYLLEKGEEKLAVVAHIGQGSSNSMLTCSVNNYPNTPAKNRPLCSPPGATSQEQEKGRFSASL